jgi:hypothetical protein
VGIKYEWKTIEMVSSTAEALKKASEQLTQVAYEMQQHDLRSALFPWTQRQWDCHDVIVTLANQCVAVLPAQILAKAQNRPSQFEIMQMRSQRDIAARKARQGADPNAPKRKRGRPRKNPE